MSKKRIYVNNKALFCQNCANYLSSLLNTKILFPDVLDELSLYQWGMEPKDKILSQYVIKYLEDCTVNQEVAK